MTDITERKRASGKIIGFCGIARDITERKRTEEALKQSEEKYRALINNIQDGVFVIQDDKLQFANEAFVRMAGYKLEEIIGMDFKKLIGPEDLDMVTDRYRRRQAGEKVPEEYEFRLLHKDGITRVIVNMTVGLITYRGRVASMGTVKNITERKQSEEELRHSEEKYRNIIEHSNDAIYLFYEGKFEVINKRFEEIFGVTQEEARAPDFNFMELVAPKSRELVKERARMLAQGQELTNRYEFTALTKAGKEIEVEVSVSYISYRGGQATHGILRDITERKLLEAQLRQAQKMEAIGTLAGGIAHDFNNLLTGISGYTQLALAKLTPQHPSFDDLKKVEQAASRAATLTRQILAFSRKQVLEMRNVNLNKIIEDLTRFLRRIIGEHIDLCTVLGKDLPSIKADPAVVEQVLINLCVNARDAMPNGGELLVDSERVTLDEEFCQKHPWANPGEYVLLLVSDTGTGMDSETQEHIFEPFFTTKQAGEGTGLGLAMVYGLVKQHNGFINDLVDKLVKTFSLSGVEGCNPLLFRHASTALSMKICNKWTKSTYSLMSTVNLVVEQLSRSISQSPTRRPIRLRC